MDINAALAELRSLTAHAQHEGARWADLFEALDGWLSRGGFLPQDWQDAR